MRAIPGSRGRLPGLSEARHPARAQEGWRREEGNASQCMVPFLSPPHQETPTATSACSSGTGMCPFTASSPHWSSKVTSRRARSLPRPRSIGADLRGSIAAGWELFQLVEDVYPRECWVGEQPGRDLLPLALEGVLACAPVTRSSTFLILSFPLLFEQRRRSPRNAISRNMSFGTLFDRKLERRSRSRAAW